MRDFQLQTPQRDQIPSNHRSKSNSDLNKKPQKNFLVNPVATPTTKTETVALTDLSPSSSSLLSTITYDKDIANNASKNKCVNPEINSVKNMESIEVDIVIKHLKDARVQVLNSSDVNYSKKLLDALINVVIEDFYGGLYEEKDWLNKLVLSKVRVVSLSILVGILAVSVFLFSNSGAKGLHNGLTPT
ncbi:Hypothetical predicted protein [Olea europaea subsp. europaea]|uniref:Uncharacterized protein n=1 Tax=Olea europaea subsp. europaea TaxID=158383 RepID=A0A8S0QKX7_OLEEU|nr:Hypothetical predicted protein [Olea europaea subsp. europaea]